MILYDRLICVENIKYLQNGLYLRSKRTDQIIRIKFLIEFKFLFDISHKREVSNSLFHSKFVLISTHEAFVRKLFSSYAQPKFKLWNPPTHLVLRHPEISGVFLVISSKHWPLSTFLIVYEDSTIILDSFPCKKFNSSCSLS